MNEPSINDKDRIRTLEQEIARDRDMFLDLLRDENKRADAAESECKKLRAEIERLRSLSTNCLTFKGGAAVDKWAKANK